MIINGHSPEAIEIAKDEGIPRNGRFRVFRTIKQGDVTTDLAWDAHVEEGKKPGTFLIRGAAYALGLLDAGLLYVTWSAQYKYISAAKHAVLASQIQAGMLDAGMVIFSLLGLGLSLAGKSSRAVRSLIMACSGLSALMAYAASDKASPGSILVYTIAPVFAAIVTDQVISTVRRHVKGIEETSAWLTLGSAVRGSARLTAKTCLYSLRLVLAPRSTASGVRQAILVAAPLPEVTVPVTEWEKLQQEQARLEELAEVLDGEHLRASDDLERLEAYWDDITRDAEKLSNAREALEQGRRDLDTDRENNPVIRTKKSVLLALYMGHPAKGNRGVASKVAAELAPKADLQPGTARSYIYGWLTQIEAGQAAEAAGMTTQLIY